MLMMHSPALLDHFQNPRHAGELPPPCFSVDVNNPACGDMLRLTARIENGVCTDVRFRVRGCTASIAAGSALAETLHGRSIAELRSLDIGPLIDTALGGLQPASKHVTVLCADAVKALLKLTP